MDLRSPGAPAGTVADRLVPFGPAVTATRAGALALTAALAAPAVVEGDAGLAGWCVVVVAYQAFRLARPLAWVDDHASVARVVGESTLAVVAVLATGSWDSPLVFTLFTAVVAAGFAQGFAFALRVAAATAAAVAVPDLVGAGTSEEDLRTNAQWVAEMLLVALVAGYARRVSGEASRERSVALDRLGRLADANTLLFSLHQVAQTLPTSLDLHEVLDSTVGRLREVFEAGSVTVVLHDEPPGRWWVARGPAPADDGPWTTATLPAPMAAAVAEERVVEATDRADRRVCAPLVARGAHVGVVALEPPERFGARERELLAGLVEPAALAIDNARWFARLRTVGADEERTRIAGELHDRVGQSLAYLGLELDRITKHHRRGDDVGPALEGLRGEVRELMGEVRHTLSDLRTDVDEDHDLATTLERFLDRVGARSGVAVALDHDVTRRPPLRQERELWRIAQEAVAHAERHAGASRLSVRWRSNDEEALLEVADDGGAPDARGHPGLRERAASIGAHLDVVTEPGGGTRVRCRLVRARGE